jgi:hypothetical protein
MEAVRSSETSVSYHNTTRRHSAEELDFNLHRREDLRSRILKISVLKNRFGYVGGLKCCSVCKAKPTQWASAVVTEGKTVMIEVTVIDKGYNNYINDKIKFA